MPYRNSIKILLYNEGAARKQNRISHGEHLFIVKAALPLWGRKRRGTMTISKKLDKLYMDKEYYENRIDDLYERLNVVFNEVRRERIYELVNAFEEKLSGIMSEIEELEIEEEQAV